MKILNKYLDLRYAAFAILFAILAPSVQAQKPKTLVVNGKNTESAILQNHGRTYVDLEILAQALNGTVAFQQDQIVLTIPGASNGDEDSQQSQQMISKEYASAALAELALIEEWKGAIETMISLQLPVTGTYFPDYRDRAESGLHLASLAATTDPDHQAQQLLQNEFSNLAKWAGDAIATRLALNATRTMSPDVLKNDTELQKLSDCRKDLSTMLVGRAFADIPTCH